LIVFCFALWLAEVVPTVLLLAASAVAMAANVAGLSTPIGSGPNGIAIAALEDRAPITCRPCHPGRS